jgi:hypothetical protein
LNKSALKGFWCGISGSFATSQRCTPPQHCFQHGGHFSTNLAFLLLKLTKSLRSTLMSSALKAFGCNIGGSVATSQKGEARGVDDTVFAWTAISHAIWLFYC